MTPCSRACGQLVSSSSLSSLAAAAADAAVLLARGILSSGSGSPLITAFLFFFVDLCPLFNFRAWPLCVSSDSGKYLLTPLYDSPVYDA